MNEELIQTFNNYVNAFKELDISDKRIEIVNSLKEISAFLDAICEKENKNIQFLKSKEIFERNNGEEDENDFLEALLVYIENIKNLLGEYLIDKI